MNLDQTILFISGISTPVLAILTGIYVYLTRKLVKSSIEANRQNQQATKEQVRAMTAPYLRCSIYQLKDKLHFKLSNIGNGPAYDIDLLAIGHYSDDEVDISQFVAKDSKGNLITPKLDEDGLFHIYDRICYGHVFHRSEADAHFAFPERPMDLTILLQYRDISSDNFAQIYWFFESFIGPKRFYKLGACDPKVITVSPRIEFETEPLKLVVEQSKELPNALTEASGYHEFKSSFKVAVSSGYFVPDFEIEDRGEWTNI
jgi:hypothetical protein